MVSRSSAQALRDSDFESYSQAAQYLTCEADPYSCLGQDAWHQFDIRSHSRFSISPTSSSSILPQIDQCQALIDASLFSFDVGGNSMNIRSTRYDVNKLLHPPSKTDITGNYGRGLIPPLRQYTYVCFYWPHWLPTTSNRNIHTTVVRQSIVQDQSAQPRRRKWRCKA